MENQTRQFVEANRKLWDEWTRIDVESALYDVEGFRGGKRTLNPLEIAEVGPVARRSMLHLQCHFGLDTLSWADLGAEVTGVDFSGESIRLARQLSHETGLAARFIEADIADLPSVHDERYDIVFASYGVIYWHQDIRRWARVAAHFLKPGGTFYLVEVHPMAYVFDDSPCTTELRVRSPYFHAAEPQVYSTRGTSFSDPDAVVESELEYGWCHTVGDLVSALVEAGLRIEFLHEHPFTTYRQLPFLEHSADGYWRVPGLERSVPLLYSVRASKP